MEENTAISVEHVNKIYKLYPKPMDRVIDTFHLMPWRKYGEHAALKDVSFTVNRGETVGIIGTNGSGKSTILKIITGVLHETSGSIQVNGRISALLELGAGFNAEYTGMENIYLNGTMIGFSKEEIDAKFREFWNLRTSENSFTSRLRPILPVCLSALRLQLPSISSPKS